MPEMCIVVVFQDGTRMRPELLEVLFSRLLSEHPIVKVHVMDHKGLVIPEDVRPGGKSCEVFEYGLNLPMPIVDLEITSRGISATLSFSRTPRRTFVPWDAVAAFSISLENLNSPRLPKPKLCHKLSLVP
jgi:hypothetical protein